MSVRSTLIDIQAVPPVSHVARAACAGKAALGVATQSTGMTVVCTKLTFIAYTGRKEGSMTGGLVVKAYIRDGQFSTAGQFK